MKRSLALALLLCGISGTAHAQSGRGDTCAEVAGNARDRACLQRLVADQELRLAEVWKRVFAKFGGSQSASGRALLSEQRAWIAFKDKACGLYFLPGLSAMEWTNGQRCKARQLLDRIEQLVRLEGDFPGED